MNPLSSKRLSAIPLARFEAKPGNWVLAFFTEEAGQIRAHSRKPSAKKSGTSANPSFFSTFNLLVQPPKTGGGLYDLKEREMETHRPGLASGRPFPAWATASVLGDLLLRTTEIEDPHPYLYRMLGKALDCLESGIDDSAVLIAFLLKFLEHMGFRPRLDRCLCDRPVDFGKPLAFDIPSGGLRCPRCPPGEMPSFRSASEKTKRIGQPEWQVLQKFRLARFESLGQTVLPRETAQQLVGLLGETLEYHFDVRLKSLDFWAEAHPKG